MSVFTPDQEARLRAMIREEIAARDDAFLKAMGPARSDRADRFTAARSIVEHGYSNGR